MMTVLILIIDCPHLHSCLNELNLILNIIMCSLVVGNADTDIVGIR